MTRRNMLLTFAGAAAARPAPITPDPLTPEGLRQLMEALKLPYSDTMTIRVSPAMRAKLEAMPQTAAVRADLEWRKRCGIW